jgi:methylenetetrahydrofolate dehydrogenase (NADP+)/methenyltetrahydrofolate cyclohydrolase
MYKDKIFNGKIESLKIKEELIKSLYNKKRTLGIIQLGDDRMSNIFIKEKIKFAKDINVNIVYQKLESGSKQLESYINKFNEDENIDAYLIQLPLLGIKDSSYFLNKIDPKKDIDCLTIVNYSNLLIGNYKLSPGVYSAFIYIFDKLKLDKSANILIVGGGFVGTSIANYLIRNKYNITLLDKYSKDLKAFSRKSDMVIFCAGIGDILEKNDVKENSILINIGASANLDGTFSGGISESTIDKSKFFVPVKGGIGPMTVAMLFNNLISID